MSEQVDVGAIVARVQEASEKFDKMCIERHTMGEERYGALTFLENDVILMALEEIVDLANYARYQFIKLELLRQELEARNNEDSNATSTDSAN